MIVNQIKADGVIPAEWKLGIIASCYKGKWNALEGGNLAIITEQGRAIITEQALKIVVRELSTSWLMSYILVSYRDMEQQGPFPFWESYRKTM